MIARWELRTQKFDKAGTHYSLKIGYFFTTASYNVALRTVYAAAIPLNFLFAPKK